MSKASAKEPCGRRSHLEVTYVRNFAELCWCAGILLKTSAEAQFKAPQNAAAADTNFANLGKFPANSAAVPATLQVATTSVFQHVPSSPAARSRHALLKSGAVRLISVWPVPRASQCKRVQAVSSDGHGHAAALREASNANAQLALVDTLQTFQPSSAARRVSCGTNTV